MMFTPILIDWIVFSGENHWLTQPQWMSPGQLMVMMRPVTASMCRFIWVSVMAVSSASSARRWP